MQLEVLTMLRSMQGGRGAHSIQKVPTFYPAVPSCMAGDAVPARNLQNRDGHPSLANMPAIDKCAMTKVVSERGANMPAETSMTAQHHTPHIPSDPAVEVSCPV